jgi:HAD superfamily hydrolase (TIGR01509 family)
VTAAPPFVPDGFIFDLDGTLLDNMPLHMTAFARFAERHGLPPLRPADRARFDGKRNRDIFPALVGRELSDDEQRQFAEEKEADYRELSRGRLAPLAGLHALLRILYVNGIAVGVATSAPLKNVEHTLGELGLFHLASFTARSDEVARGKPFPDVFLAAASLVGVAPERCVAFEDAAMGIQAAQTAGMKAIAITTTFRRDQFVALGATPDEAVADYDEFLARCAADYLPGISLPGRS